jgi:hypothetical protein
MWILTHNTSSKLHKDTHDKRSYDTVTYRMYVIDTGHRDLYTVSSRTAHDSYFGIHITNKVDRK